MSSPSAPVDSPMGSPCANSPSQSSSGFVEADTKGAKSEPRPLYDTLGNEFTIPDFTMKQVFDAIPKHCFQRSTIRGLSYALCDCLLIASTFYIFYNYATPEIVPNKLVRGALWTVYTIIQGMLGMGIWVLAHECCHRAFSESKFVCDLVGFVFHSSVLMPYFSWQISHRKHHRMSGNIAKDMLYIPRTREEYASRFQRTIYDLTELTEESPITTMLELFLQHLFGFSLYLLGNATGPDNHEDQPEGRGKGYKNGLFGGVNHFNPRSPLFDHKDVKAIIYSDIGVFLVGTILYHGVKKFGWANMLVWYFAPWLWLHSWLVAITYLQHTDPTLPRYSPEGWTFTRGAAVTIDREFGFLGKHVFHDVIETHVVHHLCSRIPFYHAREATEAIKPIMGRHYRSDSKSGPQGFFRAMWKLARTCQWVEPMEGAEGENAHVLFYRNRNGIGLPPMNLKKE